MKALFCFLLLSVPAFGQSHTALIPKYFSSELYSGTGSFPELSALNDSQANFIRFDGVYNGEVDDSVPAHGPWDSLLFDVRTEDSVHVIIYYTGWNRANRFLLCDTTGPLDWSHSIPLSANPNHYAPDERNPGFIIVQVPNTRQDGSENGIGRVFWGSMFLSKPYAGVSEHIVTAPVHYRYFNELGIPVDSLSPEAVIRH